MSQKTTLADTNDLNRSVEEQHDSSFSAMDDAERFTSRDDVAHYIVGMTEALERLAKGYGLDVLCHILSMARQQALDDVKTQHDSNVG